MCYNPWNELSACAAGVGTLEPNPRFIDNKNGTITDNLTGLMWTKSMNLIGGVNWNTALAYITDVNSGKNPNFGYKDWRVPNRRELLYMFDWTNHHSTNFAGYPIFTNEVGAIWTSTTAISNNNDSAWMFFVLGQSLRSGTKGSGTAAVWPVRTVPAQ